MEMAYRERWEEEIAEMRRVHAGFAMKEECKSSVRCTPGFGPGGDDPTWRLSSRGTFYGDSKESRL
jgi:hypothetical protein